MSTDPRVATDGARLGAPAARRRVARPSRGLAGAWRLDPTHSRVEFEVGHFWGLLKVRGRFGGYDGRLDLSADPAVELTIDAGSVQTGNDKRDSHLRSADFFDVDAHRYVRFVSDSARFEDRTLTVRGQLHARGGHIPLEVEAQIREIGEELEIEAATIAPHRELGMTWNKLGMISSRSRLAVRGRVTRPLPRHIDSATGSRPTRRSSSRRLGPEA